MKWSSCRAAEQLGAPFRQANPIHWLFSFLSFLQSKKDNQFKLACLASFTFLFLCLIWMNSMKLVWLRLSSFGGAPAAGSGHNPPKKEQPKLHFFIHQTRQLHKNQRFLITLPAPTPSISISLSINLPIRKRRLMREKRLIGEGRLMLHGPHLFLQVS